MTARPRAKSARPTARATMPLQLLALVEYAADQSDIDQLERALHAARAALRLARPLREEGCQRFLRAEVRRRCRHPADPARCAHHRTGQFRRRRVPLWSRSRVAAARREGPCAMKNRTPVLVFSTKAQRQTDRRQTDQLADQLHALHKTQPVIVDVIKGWVSDLVSGKWDPSTNDRGGVR